jgi:hypothetical protein
MLPHSYPQHLLAPFGQKNKIKGVSWNMKRAFIVTREISSTLTKKKKGLSECQRVRKGMRAKSDKDPNRWKQPGAAWRYYMRTGFFSDCSSGAAPFIFFFPFSWMFIILFSVLLLYYPHGSRTSAPILLRAIGGLSAQFLQGNGSWTVSALGLWQ